MARMLETYQSYKTAFDSGLQTAKPGPADLWRHQELLYRIGVLETLQTLVKTAPKTMDMKMLVQHYQLMDAFVQNLTLERRFAPVNGAEAEKRRETAFHSLLNVIADYRRRFSSFAPTADEQYPKDILAVICAVIAAWAQYRNTYIEII